MGADGRHGEVIGTKKQRKWRGRKYKKEMEKEGEVREKECRDVKGGWRKKI